MHEDIRERISQRLAALKKSERKAVRDAGLGESAIRDIGRLKRGKPVSPTIATIVKIADALDSRPAWIAFGEGGEERSRPQPGLSVVGEVAAGVWRQADADAVEDQATLAIPDPRFPSDSQYLLRAVGTSMNRIIEPGAIIHCVDIFKSGLAIRPGDIVVVERRRISGEREVSAKRFFKDKRGPVFRADSTDPTWAGYELSTKLNEGDEIVATALVLRVLKELS